MTSILLVLLIVVLVVALAILAHICRGRQAPVDLTPVTVALAALEKGQNRAEEAQEKGLAGLRQETSATLNQYNQAVLNQMFQVNAQQKGQLDSFAQQLAAHTKANDEKADRLREAVDLQLKQLHEENTRKLEEMRKTVDEKLQVTLEKQLGNSFRQVSDRLEQVHKGLGEMQTLASGVGDLKKVLTNVKTRGTWGEIQLGNLLEQLLTPEQFARNVATRPGSGERVEFALKLPGKQDGKPVWLPIDAKFPQEDYARIQEAAERADAEAAEAAAKKLEQSLRNMARDIRDKYLNPPDTTDFGILYLPTEGLYSEALRRPELLEALQREYRVIPAGPTTLGALLNALQMGFRSLAIERRASEIMEILGGVKAEVEKYGAAIDKVKKKLDEAASGIDAVQTRNRAINKRLKAVESLPESALPLTLGLLADVEEEPDQEA